MQRLVTKVRTIPLAGHALVLFAGFCALGVAGDLAERVPLYLALHTLLAAICLHAAHVAERRGLALRPFWILAAAAAFRAVLIPADPALSDDLWRYLWDGRVGAAGVNPFAHAPASEALAALRGPGWASINHPEIPTIYPPLAQAAFRAARWLGTGPAALKTLWVACDLALGAILAAILARTGRPASRLVLYAWNPLVVVEVARAGHVDVLGVLFVVGALGLAAAGRRSAALVGVALSGLAKLIPFGLALWFVRRVPWWTFAVAAGIVVLAYLPFAGAGRGLFEGLGAYGANWRFHPLVYDLTLAAVGDPAWTRALLLAAWVALTVASVARGDDLERTAFVFFGAYLALSPTLHPWYYLWVLPFAALRDARAWWLAAATAPLGYLVLGEYRATGLWRELPWVPAATWTALAVGWMWDRLRARRPTAGVEAPSAS